MLFIIRSYNIYIYIHTYIYTYIHTYITYTFSFHSYIILTSIYQLMLLQGFTWNETELILLKPKLFMNVNGKSVLKAFQTYKIETANKVTIL